MRKKWLVLCLLICLLPCCVQAENEREIDWSRPVVALTFDDGPSEYTPQILETLAENGARATFFMLGKRMGPYKDIVQAVAASDHEIGTHTWGHEQLDRLDFSGIFTTLQEGTEKIKQLTGRETRFLRPPYGAVGGDLYVACRQKGLIIVVWSLDSQDWAASSPEEISETILTKVQSGDIILCHDTLWNTAEAMKTVIPELVARGYQLLTLTELFSGYEEELVSTAKYSHLNLDRVKVHK